jgi:oligogalacturonide transport system substrate-binding protein
MKKIFIFLLAVLLSGSIFAGAGGGEKTSAPEGKETASTGPVNLRFSWWGGDARHKATLQALDLYHQKNPNVTVEGEYGVFTAFYQKLVTQLSGGTAPDVFFVDFKWVYDLLAQNKEWFVNMETLQNQIDMSGIDLNYARSWASMDNFLIGLPVGLNAIGMVCNADLLQQAGIPLVDTWTWDDVLTAGVKMQQYDSSKYLAWPVITNAVYCFKTWLKQKTGNDVVKDDRTLGVTTRDVAEFFEYVVKLVDTKTIPPFEEFVPFEGVQADQVPGWLTGRYAMGFTSSSHIDTLEKVSKFKLGVIRWPIHNNPKNPGLITAPTMMITLNSRSKNLPEAIKFINWFLNDDEAIDILGDTRGLPANKKARDFLVTQNRLNPLIAHLIEVSIPFTGGPEGGLSQNQEVNTLILEYIHQVGYKRMAPQPAAERFIADLQNLVKDLKI